MDCFGIRFCQVKAAAQISVVQRTEPKAGDSDLAYLVARLGDAARSRQTYNAGNARRHSFGRLRPLDRASEAIQDRADVCQAVHTG